MALYALELLNLAALSPRARAAILGPRAPPPGATRGLPAVGGTGMAALLAAAALPGAMSDSEQSLIQAAALQVRWATALHVR